MLVFLQYQNSSYSEFTILVSHSTNRQTYKLEWNKLVKFTLSHVIASGSDITPCNEIDKPLVLYRFRDVTL